MKAAIISTSRCRRSPDHGRGGGKGAESGGKRVQRLAYNVSLVETAKLKKTTMDLSNVIDKISG